MRLDLGLPLSVVQTKKGLPRNKWPSEGISMLYSFVQQVPISTHKLLSSSQAAIDVISMERSWHSIS